MKVLSIRHGESILNSEGKVSGIQDVALSEEGVFQAEALAQELAIQPIDAIVSSPLIRAQRTAQIIAHAKGLPVIEDIRLMEQNYGSFECGSRDNPDFLLARNSFASKIPDGESMFRVVQRVYNLLDELKLKYASKTVLLVSHSAICRVIHSYFTVQTDEDFIRFRLRNCDLKEYESID